MPYYPSTPGNQPPPRNPRSPVKLILLCVSVLLIVYGGIRLAAYLSDLDASRRATRELREIAAAADRPAEPTQQTASPLTSPAPATPALPAAPALGAMEPPADQSPPAQQSSDTLPDLEYPGGYEISPSIRELRKKSEYILGWLAMDDLDEPVVQKDNTFFLDHDPTGRRNVNGALFLDESISLLIRPYTFLVYGHNMKTGAMFGNLRKFEDPSYYYKHRVFRFDTLYEEGQFVVFAAGTIHLISGHSGYVSLPDLQSVNRETRRSALKSLIAVSPLGHIVDVNEEDQILLLITCTGDDDERLVVAARRLRADETPEKITLP